MTDLIKREEVWAKITQYVSTHQIILLPHIQRLINDIPAVEQDRPTEHKPICDDCIYFDNGKGSEKCDSCELTGTNKPSKREGRWCVVCRDDDVYDIKGKHTWAISCYCSECNYKHKFIEGYIDYKICPNCGAEM